LDALHGDGHARLLPACAANHKLPLEHCDSHFDKVLPIAAKL
jgi:PIN domain nuclease of toxin-antitoxin system